MRAHVKLSHLLTFWYIGLTLLDLDWFWFIGLGPEKDLDYLDDHGLILLYVKLRLIKLINRPVMLLGKYEGFLKLHVSQLVIQPSPIFLS